MRTARDQHIMVSAREDDGNTTAVPLTMSRIAQAMSPSPQLAPPTALPSPASSNTGIQRSFSEDPNRKCVLLI